MEPEGSLPEFLYLFLLSPMRSTCPVLLVHLRPNKHEFLKTYDTYFILSTSTTGELMNN
jgi:hypothetical protein